MFVKSGPKICPFVIAAVTAITTNKSMVETEKQSNKEVLAIVLLFCFISAEELN